MRKFYTLEQIDKACEKSIYLAGPTYRPGQEVNSQKLWRSKAIACLEKLEFEGDVYIPEYNPKSGKPAEWTYSRQVSWELEAMDHAGVILFWIPRDMKDLPALTTNIEFGEWMHSNKLVVGYPAESEKNRYIGYRCSLLKIPFSDNLCLCINVALDKLSKKSKPKIFFTADNHFGSQRTLELSKRPFVSVRDMDWAMIKNWNTTVSEKDHIYHLGDIGNPEIIPLLNGKISFVRGNYDSMDIMEYLERLGVEILLELNRKYYRINILGHDFTLVHEPVNYVGNNGFMLFGHIHKLQMVKKNGLNVGVDCHNFTPIDTETVLFYKNAILNHYDENVFC